MTMPSISLVCVTFNRAEYLKECLSSVFEQTLRPCEIIVVDNASADETVSMLQENFPSVRLIKMHRNIGFFPALNIAIANTQGDLIFTIDDDAYFLDCNVLEVMAQAFDSESDLKILTCNIEGEREEKPLEKDSYVHCFKTGFSMIRASIFRDQIGYYPDIFFRSAGEGFLAAKVWDDGGRVKQLSQVRMYHHLAMQGRITRDWLFYGTRSQVLLVIMRNHWLIIPARLSAKFVRGFIFVLRKRGAILTWLSAWLSALFHLRDALRQRHPISLETERLLSRLKSMPMVDPPSFPNPKV